MVDLVIVGRRGRPSTDGVHGTITGTGEHGVLSWSDGRWAGTALLVVSAKRICAFGEVLDVPGTGGYVVADAQDPVAVVAVIAALVGRFGRVEGQIPVTDLDDLRAAAEADSHEFDGPGAA